MSFKTATSCTSASTYKHSYYKNKETSSWLSVHGDVSLLFPLHNFLDFIQLVQGFERSEIIHINIQDFIPHLTKHGVVHTSVLVG